jgi:glycogen debranching enzyme
MEEVVSIEDRHYILAGSGLADPRALVLKDDCGFALFAPTGDLDVRGGQAHGVYRQDMRYLSRLETRLQGKRPMALTSSVSADNTRLLADLTNPDIRDEESGRVVLHRGDAHLSRHIYMHDGCVFQRLVLTNFDPEEREYTLSFTFDADFTDIFEVRGERRERRGERLEPFCKGDSIVVLGYQGLDGVERRTQLEFDPPPRVLSVSHVRYAEKLGPGERREIQIVIRTDPQVGPGPADYQRAKQKVRRHARAVASGFARVHSSNEQLTRWAHRSYADVRMLLTQTPHGPYPYAGIPWYCTPFGRDGIITAIQLCWVNPDVARGALRFLAAHQATDFDPARDAEPGKIIHEYRDDEMSNLREVPFGRYYGTVDATPLFVMLAGEYYRTTGDLPMIESIWPNIQRALEWIDRFGDVDGDGFVEYQRKSEAGLNNQGWKDAADSVFHADGRLAHGPIALCEVQGYVYDAKRQAAILARALGLEDDARQLDADAELLKRRFNEIFWEESIGMYALALDGEKQSCAVRSSNPGHCLFTGIADQQAAQKIAAAYLEPDMFSGWGVRTIGTKEARYNPMSYHNGSIWPHDNSIALAGMARYGLDEHVLRLFSAWLDASEYMEVHRLPELFCGFRRRAGIGPTLYPVACSPQAWAAGAVFLMLRSVLGLEVDGVRNVVRIRRPRLPDHVDQISLSRLRVPNGTMGLVFRRAGEDVGVLVSRRVDGVRVVIEK